MNTNRERRSDRHSQLHTIRVKIFLLRVGVGLAMSVTIGVACYFTIRSYILAEQENNLAQDTLIIQDAIQHQIEEQIEFVQRVAQSEQVKKYQQSFGDELLQRYFKDIGTEVTCISYVDKKGKEKVKSCRGASADDKLEDISSDQNYLKAVKTPGKVIISPPQNIDSLDEFGLIYDLLSTNFDQRVGFVRSITTLSMFDEVLAQARVKMTGSIYVTTGDGVVIHSPLVSDLGQSTDDSQHYFHPIFAMTQGANDFRGMVNMLDRRYKFAMSTMPDLGWKVFAIQDITELEKPVARIRNFIIGVSVFILILGEIISRSIGLRLTEPIAKLNSLALSVVHSGRLSDRVDWQSADELGELASSINLMLNRLENSQSELVEEKQFVENILTSMVGCLATVSEKGIIIKLNHELLELTGYHEKEILGQHYQNLFPVEHQPLMAVEKLNFVDQEVVRIEETAIVARNGSEIPVNCTVSVINDADGQPRGLLFILNDIREKKRLENERLAAEKKLRATQDDLLKTEKMAVVGQMAGMVAHEVLNPISAVNIRVDLSMKKGAELAKILEVLIKIITDWQVQVAQGTFMKYFAVSGTRDLALLEKIAKNLDTRQADRIEDFQFIERQIQRVIKIIDGLREMSRMEKTVERVPLDKVLEEVLDDMQDGIRKRGIEVETDWRCPSLSVMADYMEIYSIFSNIVKNAMQSIDNNRQAAERRIRISLYRNDEGQACVEFADTGIGLDEEAKESIFTPGFTSKGRDGTGIGSSFSRKLARNYGGDILLKESTPGRGATFLVLLAIAGEKEK